MYELIDTHAHLEEIENLKPVLDKATAAGVRSIICVGQSPDSNRKVLDIAGDFPHFVYPAMGLHPWEINKLTSAEMENMLGYIESNIQNIVGIGEIGLDYDKRVIKLTSKDGQKAVFRRFLELAAKYNKPVSVHSRYAWKDGFDIVKDSGIKKAVFHWFTGFSSVLKDIIDSGYYISATPASEYHDEHRRAIRETPLEQLLLETDCPVTYRGMQESSQPADVLRSLKATALIKGLGEEEIAEKTTYNARRVFGT